MKKCYSVFQKMAELEQQAEPQQETSESPAEEHPPETGQDTQSLMTSISSSGTRSERKPLTG